MSRGINKVILIGHLGADPELRALPSGDPVASFSLATGEAWKDKTTGETRERTDWHRVVLFGRLADIARQYLHTGSKVYVEGKLRTRQSQAQDGSDRFTTEVILDLNGTLQLLDSRAAGSSDPEAESCRAPERPASATPARTRPSVPRTQARPSAPPERAPPPDFNDDIPF